jgi:hypothetical protein
MLRVRALATTATVCLVRTKLVWSHEQREWDQVEPQVRRWVQILQRPWFYDERT